MSNTSTTERARTAPALVQGPFRLDGWLVDPSLNRIERAGIVVHVRPQLVDVLAYLAARPGQVVSKESLLSAVWSDRFVVETAVGRCMCELRRVLEDNARAPRVIETVAKRGYRLKLPVEPVDDEASCQAARPPAGRDAGWSPPELQRRLAALARTLAGAGAALPELARFLARRAG